VFFTILKEINMKKSYLLMALLPFLLVSVAYAHGPVRQKVEEQITINAPAQKVWGIIKEYGDASWMPAVKNTTVKGGNTEGATRVLTLQDGGTVTEELKKYDEGKMSFAYKITEMSTAKTINHAGADTNVPVIPVDNYAASIDLEAKGETTVVTWKAGFYRAYTNNNPPPEMNEEAANNAINGIFKASLENLKKLAEK
jgi:carbon monoxide dehydrogenase subunit G